MYLSLSIQRHIHLCRHAALACCRCSCSAPPPLQAQHARTHIKPPDEEGNILLYIGAACQSGDPSEYGSRSQFAAHCDPSDASQLLQLQPICLIISTFCACGFWVKRGTITGRACLRLAEKAPRDVMCKNPQWWPLGIAWYQFVVKVSWCYRFMCALCSLNQIGSRAKTADIPRGDGGLSNKSLCFRRCSSQF